MKKIYFLISFMIVSMFAFSQPVPRNWVLVEIGTGAWCYYCPGAALGADDLIANGDPAAIIENHNGDPYATTDSDARNSYYGITGYPTAWFDGSYDSYVGGDHTQSLYSTYEPIVSSRISMDSDFTLDIFGTNDGDDYDITLRLQDVNNYSGTNLALRFALTESEIQYSWQGQSELNFVNRLMLPDHNGTDLSSYDLTQLTNIDLDFTFSSSWNSAHCEIVVFIQDDDTKEVLQSQKVALDALIPLLIADFEASDTISCSGSTIDFTDLSEGVAITSWSWTFQGGTPSSSTNQNPTVTYSNTGVYDVQLTITDATGSDTKLITDYINILETPGQAETPGGDDEVCTGQYYDYSISEVPYTQVYEWELTPADAGTIYEQDNEASFEVADDWTGDFSIRVRATNICGDGDWSDYTEGTIYQSPEEYILEGGGAYCVDDSGAEITLSGSETGVDYELFVNGETTGILLEGTGSEISFGDQADEGYYTALGFTDNCSLNMMEQIQVYTISPPLEPAAPEGVIAVCNDEVSDYSTTGSEDADDYNWYIDPIEAGTIISDGLDATIEWDSDYSGTASVTVTGINDCGEGNYSEALVIDIDDIPEPEIAGEDMVCDEEEEVYAVNLNEDNIYNWEVVGGEITEGQGTATITIRWGVAGEGNINLEEETPNGCLGTATEFLVTIDDCTGLPEDMISNFNLYPNPAEDKLHIEFNSSSGVDGEILILNQLGQTVIMKKVNNDQTITLDISNLNNGIYVVNFRTENSNAIVKQFIKK